MKVYMVQNGEFVPSSIQYYPLFNQIKQIVGLILAKWDEKTGQPIVNYTTELCEELNKNYEIAGCCIIIDAEAIYINKGIDFKKISENEVQENSLCSLEHVLNKDFNLAKSCFTIKKQLVLHEESLYSVNANMVISVRGIKQDSGSQYCWACTSVSLGQYRKPNIVLSEKEIAKKYSGDLMTPQDISTCGLVLSQEYGVSTIRYNVNPTFNTIKNNINADNPMISSVRYSDGSGHSILINGYNDATSKYVVAMDPVTGTYRTLNTTSSGGNYYVAYVSPNGASASIYRYIV
ncbi:MAG: hypothetical protein HFE73_04050 [Firmicutes bacterium]|nr:hypothetical protein [Bacillota bacterium]